MRLNRAATLYLGAALVVLAAPPAEAALLTFTSRAVFNGLVPGLPVETFEPVSLARGPSRPARVR